jgi:LAO/AO transport system kinase
MLFDLTNISSGVAKGDFLLLAKALTSIENKKEGVTAFLESLIPSNAPIIGITGPPGAGKSTLIATLIGNWVHDSKKVAVLSVDPSSPFHQGAILGDRIRMKDWYLNPNVFIRSLASRGHLGGLNSSMIEMTTLLQAAGFDYILVETVGVGQSEVEVAALADTTIVVLVPEAGDEVQMMKAGLMEIADLFVVNKADRPDAATFANHIQQMVMDNHTSSWSPVVLKTVATQNIGITELINAIHAHQENIKNSQRKKRLMLNKAIQLIVADKVKSIDERIVEEKLTIALANPQFNIFEFAKQFFK